MKHFVPLDVKTEKKFSPKIFMFDFFFIIGFAGFGWATQNIVIPALVILGVLLCRWFFPISTFAKQSRKTALPVVLVLSHKTSNRVYSGSDFKKKTHIR